MTLWKSDSSAFSTRRFIWSVVAVLLLAFLVWNSPFAIVPPGYRGVLTTWGKPADQVFDEGLHLIFPLAQRMNLMDVRMQRSSGQGEAASRDLQGVTVRVIVNYHLDPKAAIKVFRDIAPDMATVHERVVEPARPEAYKAVMARYTAEELITRRTEVSAQINALLGQKLRRYGLVLDEFSIVNFAFAPTFTAAIEAKVNAEQEKLKAERDLQRIQVEAEQRIASARAEAESLRLQRQEVTPLLIDLRRAENERQAIAKWNGQLPSTSVGAGAQPFIQLPVNR